MKVLWDFRLFSYGYGIKGIGEFALRMSEAIISSLPADIKIYVWAEKNRLPKEMLCWPVNWINYCGNGNWKKDLFIIPYLIIKYRIDIFHYWIGLGPLYSIGMSIWHFCHVCVDIHDLGVELWDKDPFLIARRSSWYWKIQKKLLRPQMHIICDSYTTYNDFVSVFPKLKKNTCVFYLPSACITKEPKDCYKREPIFVTLGGSIRKNVRVVVEAFVREKTNHPDWQLCILGEINIKEELNNTVPCTIKFESIKRFAYYMYRASALVVCSWYEGLGIPVIDAMSCGCPLILSNIAVFREICPDGAYFVDPFDFESVAAALRAVAENPTYWSEKSRSCGLRYRKKSENVANEWINLYRSMDLTE